MASVALAAGCSAAAHEDDAEAQEGELRPLERRAMGKASEYPADTSLRGKLSQLQSSQRARRAAAWAALGRALAPVRIALPDTKQNGERASVPRFRTWYGKDDFERIFGKLYSDLPADERKARRPFSAAEARAGYEWNASSLGASSDEDFFARISKVNDDASLQGLGGNHRVAYSPGIFTHVLGEYGSLFECLPKLPTMSADMDPPSTTNFAPCFDQEFPLDAALVKMSWHRANFGDERLPMPTYRTDARTLAARMNGTIDDGGWGRGTGRADPDDSRIYTVSMADGTRFRMPALHLVTKELRDWLWITIWWSDTPDEDFGADRPETIKALGGPWANYKMNVAVAFDESDPDPRGGFEGSLGDAIEATYAGVGKPSWASNPYLEKGAPNAQSNCIGCHQHAGTPESTESILADPTRFPAASRTKLRKNFPADYLWALTSAPEYLAGVVEDHVKHYDSVDR